VVAAALRAVADHPAARRGCLVASNDRCAMHGVELAGVLRSPSAVVLLWLQPYLYQCH
jgi:hypothetical protein